MLRDKISRYFCCGAASFFAKGNASRRITMSFATIQGNTTAYDDVGQGEVIVLVHGHPFNRSMWSPQVRLLETKYRVITYDLRGYGQSSVTVGKVRLDDHATDLKGLLEHLNVDRIILGGLSMGGQIVMEFYRQFPEMVRALLFADTFAQLDTPQNKENRYKNADRIVSDGMDDYATELLPGMVAPKNIESQPDVAQHVLTMMQTTHPEGAAASLRGRAERRDYVPMLASVKVPTLIVVGEEDVFTPVRDAELMHHAVQGSRLEVINGAGHMPNLEQEANFNAVLTHWLASISR
jgi:pimeloyl-ACP methyl ester carboxylesterase